MIESGVVGVMVGSWSCLDFDIVEPFLNDSQLQRWAETMGREMGAGGIFLRWAPRPTMGGWAGLITSPLRRPII